MPIDKKVYPKNWAEIRARILKRADGKCEICGVARWSVGYRAGEFKNMITIIVGESYREANELRGRIQQSMNRKIIVVRLTTAHLDHNEWDHTVTDDRLACLCGKCHFNHDRKDNEKRIKYGKHFKRHQYSIF